MCSLLVRVYLETAETQRAQLKEQQVLTSDAEQCSTDKSFSKQIQFSEFYTVMFLVHLKHTNLQLYRLPFCV